MCVLGKGLEKMGLRNDVFFSDGEPDDQHQLLEELFMDLRDAETESISSIWRIGVSATAALFVASAVSPSLTVPSGILIGLAISSLLMLIPIGLYRAKSRSLRHWLVDAISAELGLPRTSEKADVREKILDSFFAEQKTVRVAETKKIEAEEITRLLEKLETKRKQKEQRIQEQYRRSKESRGLEKSGE